jgi:hypothetical protein
VAWRDALGDSYGGFKTAFLQKHKEPAHYYPCPRNCGCSHHIVVSSEFPNAVAVCQCEDAACPDIPLGAEDILLLELSWAKVARALGRALNLDLKPVDMGLLNTRQIGSWSADAVPVVLTIQSEASWFHTVILDLTSRLRSRFILLAPTSHHLNAISQEVLDRSGVGFFSLQKCLNLSFGGEVTPLLTPGELFAGFSPAPSGDEGNDARRALALIEELESKGPRQSAPSVLKIFRLFCLEELSPAAIARRCGCSRGTVINRLSAIEKKTGLPPARLRRMSDHFSKVDDQITAHGARHVHRRNLIYDPDRNDD